MKKLPLIALAIIALSSCKKQAHEYKIRFEITGKSSYTYQVGPVKKSGSAISSISLSESAHDGDYINCAAKADSSKNIKLEYYRDDRLIIGKNENNPTVNEQL